MCGIAGALNWAGVKGDGGVGQMIHRLRHRGPDDAGIWHSKNGQCVLGHARLSIIDLSSAGHQPMIDRITGNAIAFNGEIYNFKELRRECEEAGEQFFSHTDTEVILVLYRRYGVNCLKFLRGMFAFVIWDESEQKLFMARDRVGKKPLNYALTKEGIVFSSEIDPLAQHPEANSEMDDDALELYLQMQYIPAPWTIYKAIRKLPPAHYAVYDRNGLNIQQYWDVSYKSKIKISEQDALDGLEEKLKQAIKLRLIADVPLGALLSGGVDSSLIVALMSGMSSDRVKTYSIGFSEDAFNELPYAKLVADKYGTEHTPETVSGEVESLLETIVRHYGEPYADSSAVPSFHVCQTARSHVKVVMNGDGGDELLGGYPRYALTALSITAGHILGNVHSPDQLAGFVANLDKAKSIPGRARRKWLLRFAYPEMQSMLMYSAFWNDSERSELLNRGNEKGALIHNWRREWLENSRVAADNPIDRMLWMDNRTYLPGDLLVKMDIAAMHCGLEARSPLLDHEVIEYCASLPVTLKIHQRHGKYLLKKLAERYLPKELIYRQKMGFGIPLADWLRGVLKGTVQDILNDSVLMAPFNQVVIQRTMFEFFKMQIDHSSRIWSLLMFGLWCRYAKPNGA